MGWSHPPHDLTADLFHVTGTKVLTNILASNKYHPSVCVFSVTVRINDINVY